MRGATPRSAREPESLRQAKRYKSDVPFKPPPKLFQKGGQAVGNAAKKAAKSDAGKAAGGAAAGAVGAAGAKAATEAVAGSDGAVRGRIAKRKNRRMAIKLARQMQAQYSADTIIGDDTYSVVWKDGEPFRAFPKASAPLASYPELQNFPPELLRDP